VTVEPGSMRELHWHPNADEWQYYLKGSARMTAFNTGPHANTMDFTGGDVGVVKRNFGHSPRRASSPSPTGRDGTEITRDERVTGSLRCLAPRRLATQATRGGS